MAGREGWDTVLVTKCLLFVKEELTIMNNIDYNGQNSFLLL